MGGSVVWWLGRAEGAASVRRSQLGLLRTKRSSRGVRERSPSKVEAGRFSEYLSDAGGALRHRQLRSDSIQWFASGPTPAQISH